MQTITIKDTGEVVNNTCRIYTQEQFETIIKKNKKLLVRSKDNFIFITYKLLTSLNIEKGDFNQPDIARIIYIMSYISNDNRLMFTERTPMTKDKLSELMGLNKKVFKTFYNKLIKNNILIEKDNYLFVNKDFSFYGSIKGNKDIPVCWQRAERIMQGYVFEKGSCILENPPEEEKRNMSMSLKENLQEIETSMDNRNFGQALEYLYKIRSELVRSRNIYWYKDYPNFISEHIRVAPPVKHSLEKMIHGPLWDSELLSRDRYWEKDIFPVNWLERSHEVF